MGPVAHDPAPRQAEAGFTLIEIMVVVFLIGMIVVVTVLSLGATGRDSGMQQERDRLAALITYGRERGSILTLEYGIRCGQHGYRFVFYDNRLMRWAPERIDDTLRPRKLPAGLSLNLVIEGHPIVLDDNALKISQVAATAPGGTVSALGSSSGLGAIAGSAGLGALSSGGSFSSGAGGAFGSSGGFGSGFTSLGGSSSGGGTGSSGSGSSSSGGSGSGLGNQPDSNMPQIMLFSNGDTNSFALTMVRDGVNRSVTLQSSDNGDGTIKVGDIVEPKQ